MIAPWLSVALLFLVLSPVISELSQASVDSIESNSTILGADRQDPLKAWIYGLEIPLIANMSGEMPMGMGSFEVKGGYCTGLKLDRVQSEDLSSDLVLEFGLRVLGLGISCFVEGYSEGPVNINITFEDSSLNATLQINPYISDMTEDLPLPLGPMNLTSCSAGLAVTSFTHSGSGTLAQTMDYVGPDIVSLVGMAINEPLCEGMKSYLATNGTAAAAQAAGMVSMLLLPPFPDPEPKTLKPLLDWEEYPPIAVVDALLAERFHLFSGRVLDIINTKDFDSKLLQQDDVQLTLSTLKVQGRGGDHDLGLDIRARESSLGLAADMPGMTIKTELDVAVTLPEQPRFNQQVGVTIGLTQVAMGLRAMVDENTLNNLQLDDAMHSPRCIAQCAEGTTDPRQEAIAIEDFHVELRPLLEITAAGSLATDGSHLINTFVGALYKAYFPTVNALVNGALGMSKGVLDDLIWKQINALPPCSREDMFFVLGEKGVLAFWTSTVVITAIGIPIALLAHLFWKRAAPASGSTAEAPARAVNVASTIPIPLACEPCVPRALAVYYPFAVVAVMALFLYADLDIGTTVTMVMEADGKTAQIGPLFSFSLVNTVSHCWSSKAYFLAVLTVIASGVWPFTKLFLLLVAWLVPPRCFSVWRRGKILAFLDTWGKYSFLDSWFLVLTLSAFALEWMSVGSASLKIQTTPAPAFYAFFAATVLSLILGHVASEFHRVAGETAFNAQKTIAEEAVSKVKTTTTATTIATTSTSEAELVALSTPVPLCGFAASSAERVAIPVALCTSGLLVILGTFLTSFGFEMSGIFPQFLFGDALEKSYSLFSVGMSVASGRYNEMGLIGLEIVFVVLSVIVPAVLLGLLSFLWFAPLCVARQRFALHACKVLDAWSSFDVAALVLAIACGEFARLAEWLVYEGNFAAPCKMVKDLTKDECMKIEFQAYPALTALFLAGVALIVVPKVAMHRFRLAIARRTESKADKIEKVEPQNVAASSEARCV